MKTKKNFKKTDYTRFRNHPLRFWFFVMRKNLSWGMLAITTIPIGLKIKSGYNKKNNRGMAKYILLK